MQQKPEGLKTDAWKYFCINKQGYQIVCFAEV